MQNKKIKVACVGDSITYNGYPTNLARMLGDGFEVENFGFNGATLLRGGIDHVDLEREYISMEPFLPSIEFNPNIVVIMLGTNDGKHFNWDRLKDNFEDDYAYLVSKYSALESVEKIFIATCATPYYENYNVDPMLVTDEVVPAIRKAAEKLGLELIDVFSATAGMPDAFEDGIHPSSEKSRDAIADAVARSINDYIKNKKD